MSYKFSAALLLTLLACYGCARETPESQTDTSPTEAVRIIFFGDSITEEGALPNGYVTLVNNSLQQEYPSLAIDIVGAGISGHKVPDLQARLDRDVLVKRPTHVVIYIGINDVWHSYAFDEVEGTEKQVFEQGLRELVRQVHNAGAVVSLCTPSVIGEDPESDEPVNQALIEYAEISRVVAREMESHLCDIRAAFEQYLFSNNPDRVYDGILTTDGVHLNEAGNSFVANVMLDHLRPLLSP